MNQRRRDLLRATGGLLVAGVLAGCSGGDSDGGDGDGDGDGDSGDGEGAPTAPDDGGDGDGASDGPSPQPTPTSTPDPVPNLEISDFDWGDADEGFVVEVTVDNVGDESGAGTLGVILTVQDEEMERDLDVSVDAGGSETYEASFDATLEAFRQDGGIDFEWQ